MRTTKLVAAIGIVSALVLAGGITAGLILARDQAPPAPAPMASEAAVPPPGAPVVDGAGQTPREAAAGLATHTSAPVTPELLVSAGAPVVDSTDQTPSEAAAGPATPTPAPAGAHTAITKESPSTENADPGRLPGTESGYGEAFSAAKGRDNASKSASPGGGANDQALPIPDKGQLKYPNLGSRLDQLAAGVESGQTTPEEAAADAPLHSGESVAVTIHLSGNVADVVAYLEENGGDPRNLGDDYIEAYVPVSLLGPVSEQPGVLRVREIVPPEPGRGG